MWDCGAAHCCVLDIDVAPGLAVIYTTCVSYFPLSQLLDDPLSAVDPRVGRILFDRCISNSGLMAGGRGWRGWKVQAFVVCSLSATLRLLVTAHCDHLQQQPCFPTAVAASPHRCLPCRSCRQDAAAGHAPAPVPARLRHAAGHAGRPHRAQVHLVEACMPWDQASSQPP